MKKYYPLQSNCITKEMYLLYLLDLCLVEVPSMFGNGNYQSPIYATKTFFSQLDLSFYFALLSCLIYFQIALSLFGLSNCFMALVVFK